MGRGLRLFWGFVWGGSGIYGILYMPEHGLGALLFIIIGAFFLFFPNGSGGSGGSLGGDLDADW